MAPIVDVRDLSRRFGAKQALRGVDYAAHEGLVYGLVGINGAGKTTLIKHILGLLRAKTGTVRVFDKDPARHPVEVLQHVGYLSEDRDLPEWMTITQLLSFTQAHYPTWDEAYARELLDTFGLDPTAQIANLSKGMRAQAGLIAAAAHRPRLLVLDEPSSGLDAVVREDILNAVLRAVTEDGRTVIFSSHLLDEVERMSDHVTMIDEGEVRLDGPLEELRTRHHKTTVTFDVKPRQLPDLPDVLGATEAEDHWDVVHESAPETLRAVLAAAGGKVVSTTTATLMDVFLARAGRDAVESR